MGTHWAVLLAGPILAGLLLPARAEIPGNTIRFVVLTDMGGANADASGPGSAAAARLVRRFPAAKAFRPLAAGGCPLVP